MNFSKNFLKKILSLAVVAISTIFFCRTALHSQVSHSPCCRETGTDRRSIKQAGQRLSLRAALTRTANNSHRLWFAWPGGGPSF